MKNFVRRLELMLVWWVFESCADWTERRLRIGCFDLTKLCHALATVSIQIFIWQTFADVVLMAIAGLLGISQIARTYVQESATTKYFKEGKGNPVAENPVCQFLRINFIATVIMFYFLADVLASKHQYFSPLKFMSLAICLQMLALYFSACTPAQYRHKSVD